MNSEAQTSSISFESRLSLFVLTAVPAMGFIFGILIILKILPTFRFPTILLFFASGCFMVVRWRGGPDLLHPVRLFGALWCFCLALASMRLLSYLSDWDFLTWGCFLSGLAGFIFGFWLIDWRSTRQISLSRAGQPTEEKTQQMLSTRKTLI